MKQNYSDRLATLSDPTGKLSLPCSLFFPETSRTIQERKDKLLADGFGECTPRAKKTPSMSPVPSALHTSLMSGHIEKNAEHTVGNVLTKDQLDGDEAEDGMAKPVPVAPPQAEIPKKTDAAPKVPAVVAALIKAGVARQSASSSSTNAPSASSSSKPVLATAKPGGGKKKKPAVKLEPGTTPDLAADKAPIAKKTRKTTTKAGN